MRILLIRPSLLLSLLIASAEFTIPIGLCSTVPAMAAAASVINFDALPDRTVVTNQYPEATFSSSAGYSNYTYDISGAGDIFNSPPNILCTDSASTGTLDCVNDTHIDFTVPVNNLTFWAIEANYGGVAAEFNVFENGTFSQTVPLYGRDGPGNSFVDLGGFINVTRVEIVNIIDDPTGIFSAPASGRP